MDFKQSWDCTNCKYFWSWAKSVLHHEMIVHLWVLWVDCGFCKFEWEISPIRKFNLSSWYPAISTVWVDYWTFRGFSLVEESILLVLGLKILLSQITLSVWSFRVLYVDWKCNQPATCSVWNHKRKQILSSLICFWLCSFIKATKSNWYAFLFLSG